jgi:Rrf2 family cysteine metabolism transcriptional repressor
MLKVSTKGRYAARIVLYLALHESKEPIRKQEIAKAEALSPDYVEQILMKLKTADLVRSHRGKRGGFTLARRPAAITVTDILEATEGPINLVGCEEDDCQRISACATKTIWDEATASLAKVFGSHTIADLAVVASEMASSKALTFHI